MFERRYLKKKLLLQLLLLLLGMVVISCTTYQDEAEIEASQATETTVIVETKFSPTPARAADILPTEETQVAKSTTIPTPAATRIITTPVLLNLEIPLETDNLPAYGWFSDDSQKLFFSYPEDNVFFSYDITAQQLVSATLSQKSDDQVIEQIIEDLPVGAHVVEISPKFQNILYTIPISQPITLERGAFTVPLSDELWFLKEDDSFRLGEVDECFLINLQQGALWSPSETLAAVNAFAPKAGAWNNWLINLETFSVTPIDETWKMGQSGFYIAAILPNKQLLLTSLIQDEPSAILDWQTQELTVFLQQGDEVVQYLEKTAFLDFLFWRSRNETEILLSPVNEKEWQLIGMTEGLVRAKYVSPDQKQVLLFSGNPDYYGLSENQETSGVWLLTLP